MNIGNNVFTYTIHDSSFEEKSEEISGEELPITEATDPRPSTPRPEVLLSTSNTLYIRDTSYLSRGAPLHSIGYGEIQQIRAQLGPLQQTANAMEYAEEDESLDEPDTMTGKRPAEEVHEDEPPAKRRPKNGEKD